MPDGTRPLGERERFVAFAFASADMLLECSEDGLIFFATGAFRARFGRSPEQLTGTSLLDLLAPEEREGLAAELSMMPLRGRLEPQMVRLADQKGSMIVVSGLHLALPGHTPRLCISFGQPPSTPDRRRPGGRGAAGLLQQVESQLRSAAQGAPGPDRLSVIELRSGHLALQPAISNVLNDTLSSAFVSAEVAPGRFGVLPRAGQPMPATDEIMAALQHAMPEQDMVRVLKLGAIALDATGLNPAQVVRAVRACLSTFATGGTDGLRDAGFDKGIAAFVADVGERAETFRRALRERRFTLQFQPILDLHNRVLHHYEALLRPDKGMLGNGQGPAEFVNLAEMVGLTEELDLAVLDQAAASFPLLSGSQRIAINMSGLSMQSAEFRQQVSTRLDNVPAYAERLMVELTESAEIEHEQAAVATIIALRDRGIPTCLDDFGAGAAAFRYLKAFPVDFVKVDGSFVEAAMTGERDRSFVASMVDLSLAVGAKVIAERIETEAHVTTMASLGVSYGQGWHLGRPGAITPPLPPKAARRKQVSDERWE